MLIGVPKEPNPDETRVPLIPETALKLEQLGAELLIESGMGEGSGYHDEEYTPIGVRIAKDRGELLASADLILRLNKPPLAEVSSLKSGSAHISYLDPFNERELVEALAAQGVSAISMEMIPRTTLAQKMDALSSQASLAGYVAVTIAASKLETVFPMMMTPAGTLSPARVFVIGAGVAGLQAIATAKRLGARVDAYDTRPAVAEQVQSLGARFVKIDLGETGQTKDGYAKALTEQQLEIQRKEMARHCHQADVVITTAAVFGRKAPRIVTREMVKGMRPGSLIIDMAVESGGNVEGSEAGREVDVNGVRIIGYTNLAGRVPKHASQMYSTNIGNLVEELWDKEAKSLKIDPENEILQGCLITHSGEICNNTIKEAYSS
jgi:NAD(P) transhydrogenase subunit alpha